VPKTVAAVVGATNKSGSFATFHPPSLADTPRPNKGKK
jgi:hypothetical protein